MDNTSSVTIGEQITEQKISLEIKQKLQINENVKLSDLPIEIKTIIVNKLDADGIINLEHAFNPNYTHYVEHGGALVRFPGHLKTYKVSYGINKIIECDFTQLMNIPKIYHENIMLVMDNITDVFSNKKRNTRYCSMIRGLTVHGKDTYVNKTLNLHDFENLRELSLTKVNVKNILYLTKIETISLTECFCDEFNYVNNTNINCEYTLINLRHLSIKNVCSMSIHDLPNLELLICTYDRDEISTIVIDLYWLIFVYVKNLPELKTLIIESMNIKCLENLPKIESLTCNNIVGDEYETPRSINHLKSLKRFHQFNCLDIPLQFINRFEFDQLNNLEYVEIEEDTIDARTRDVLTALEKKGCKVVSKRAQIIE